MWSLAEITENTNVSESAANDGGDLLEPFC